MMKRVRELDGLRVVAIFAVMAVHYRPPLQSSFNFLSIGWTGVDLFFVVSGFLITTILISLRGTQNPYRVFYWRRALRIFPPYYLVLLILTLVPLVLGLHQKMNWHWGSWLFLDSLRNMSMYLASVRSLLHGNPWNTQLLPLGDYFPADYKDGFSIFWSLSVEEIFYLIWAPIVLNCSRNKLVVIGLVAFVFCPFLRVALHSSQWEFFFFPCRFDTLMMGSLLSLLFIGYRAGEVERPTLLKGLCVTGAVSLLCLVPLCLHIGFLRQVELRSALSFTAFGYTLLGLFFTSVVGLCVLYTGSPTWWCKTLRLKPLVYIGSISYMMYMIHIPVWVTIYKIARRLQGPGTIPSVPMALLSAACTIALAAISWKFFERPILAFKDSSFPMSKRARAREDEILHPASGIKRRLVRR